jgi:Protein of unknown function (DUF3570)
MACSTFLPGRARWRRLLLRALGLAILCAAVCWHAPRARADGASGTFTGNVALRGNYYYERSTRVVAPAFTAGMETPQGIRMDATYLIDAITSASVATGVQSDHPFTEKRHDFQAGTGYEIDLGGKQLDLGLRGRFSREPDYHSRGFGFNSALSLNERNTTLRINGYYLHDDVARVDRLSPPTDPNKLVATKARPVGELDTVSLGFAIDQLLNPTASLTLGYDLGILDGFTSNPYRVVTFATGGPPEPEKHPDQRYRHGVYGWLAQYVPYTRSSIRLGYRIYHDDWSITAHAPEARVYQEVGEYVEFRFRYRYYTQTGSYFYRPGGNLRTDEYRTADPKMAPFHDHTWGFKFRLGLGFFRGTALRIFERAVVDLTVEYMIGTSRYLRPVGDSPWGALVGQGGLVWPF